MIAVDRSSSTPVSNQLADQLRFQIASARFTPGDQMPSTRALASQVGVSFHTVRKAYHLLAEEGLLEVREGSGFIVIQQVPRSKEERLERGAEIAHDALMRMAALGLSDAEVSYLFDEQRSLIELSAEVPKILMVAPYKELAELCAEQLSERVQFDVEPVLMRELHRHSDTDYVITPYSELRAAIHHAGNADVMGVEVRLGNELLDAIARLGDEHTLGVLIRDQASAPYVLKTLREHTGFDGNAVAVSVEADTLELVRRLKGCTLVAVMPSIRRRVPGSLRQEKRIVLIDFSVTEESVARGRALLPR